jgi:hypothetical protein
MVCLLMDTSNALSSNALARVLQTQEPARVQKYLKAFDVIEISEEARLAREREGGDRCWVRSLFGFTCT